MPSSRLALWSEERIAVEWTESIRRFLGELLASTREPGIA